MEKKVCVLGSGVVYTCEEGLFKKVETLSIHKQGDDYKKYIHLLENGYRSIEVNNCQEKLREILIALKLYPVVKKVSVGFGPFKFTIRIEVGK